MHQCARSITTNNVCFIVGIHQHLTSQVVNMSPGAQNMTILLNLANNSPFDPNGKVVTLTSATPWDENSFESPLKVRSY